MAGYYLAPSGMPTLPGLMLSVVVPVFNEVDSLPELHRRLGEALGPTGEPWEVVYVDDGSSDGSAALIERLAAEDGEVVLVQLSRNFGMEVAMSAGIDQARGDHVVLIHADLQDPPELIPQMLELAGEGADVVYARRIGRDESRIKRGLATAFYRLMERLARVPYQGQAGDFRLISRRVVDAIQRMPERRRFLRGMVAWAGFRQVPIEYRRPGRTQGRGASYPDLFRLAVEALTAYSDVPLSLATIVGHRRGGGERRGGGGDRRACAHGRRRLVSPAARAARAALPWRRAAHQRRHHRPLSGSGARGVAAQAALPAVASRPRARGARRPCT